MVVTPGLKVFPKITGPARVVACTNLLLGDASPPGMSNAQANAQELAAKSKMKEVVAKAGANVIAEDNDKTIVQDPGFIGPENPFDQLGDALGGMQNSMMAS